MVEPDSWRSPVAKFLTEDEIAGLIEATGAKEGDAIFVVADTAATAARVLGDLRLQVGVPEDRDDFLWVVDFPMFEWDEAEKRWDPMHHPFTAPSGDLDADPGTWRSRALRPGVERRRDRRRLDPHQHPRGAAEGVRRAGPDARAGARSGSASCWTR